MKYRLAVDVGATRTMVALVEADGPHIVGHDRPDTELIFRPDLAPWESLAVALQRFLAERQADLDQVMGVGIGVPGLVQQERGHIFVCPNLRQLDGCDLAPQLAGLLQVPVYLDNNTNLIALGEHTAGVGQGIDDLAVVFVGSGIGSGLILNGSLYRGADGLAAELGHVMVVRNGLECTCGRRGCLEMYCSGKALSLAAEEMFEPRELFELGTRFAGARLVIEQALLGRERARQVLVQSFTYLGHALANLVMMLSPRMIVLGGGIAKGWPEGINVASAVIEREAIVEVPRDLLVVRSKLEDFAGVLGGAALVSLQGKTS